MNDIILFSAFEKTMAACLERRDYGCWKTKQQWSWNQNQSWALTDFPRGQKFSKANILELPIQHPIPIDKSNNSGTPSLCNSNLNTYHGIGNEDWWVQQRCRAQTRRDREVGRWSSWHWIISCNCCTERHAELWHPEPSSCLHPLSEGAAWTGLLAKLRGHWQRRTFLLRWPYGDRQAILLKSGIGNLGVC